MSPRRMAGSQHTRGRIRIAHISTVHPVDDVRIAVKECASLAEAGYEVCLLGRPPKATMPVLPGVAVSTLAPSGSRGRRMTLGMRDALRAALRLDAEVYHLHDPELIGVGMALRVAGKRVVYDVHEDLPKQILTKPWIPAAGRPAVSGLARLTERLAAAVFSGIVAATPDIAANFPSPRTVTVQNFPSLAEFGPPPVSGYADRPQAVAYVGGLTEKRGSAEMVTAMDAVPAGRGATLVLAGPLRDDATERVIEAAQRRADVEYHPWLSRSEVRSVYDRVRAGLVVLHPEPRFQTSYPVKMFEYMAAGLPVIASDFPLWRRIIDEAACGLLVDPMDPGAIGGAIDWLLTHPVEAEAMGRRGRAAVEAHYSWDSESTKLIALYRYLLGLRAAPSTVIA